MSESDDNMFYYEEGSINDSCNSEDDVFFDEFAHETNVEVKKTFVVLNEEDVRNRMHDDVNEVSSILSVDKEVAWLLLLHYKFDVNEVHEAWFANEENVRKVVGLVKGDDVVEKVHEVHEAWFANEENVRKVVGLVNGGDERVVVTRVMMTCGICFEDYGVGEAKALSCRHSVCVSCWKGYISCSIRDGPGCLFLKCPVPKCGAAVGEGFVAEFASDAEKEKYGVYMFRSYVEAKKGMKWCPFPDCGNAVEVFYQSDSYDVTCDCSHSFCWNCGQEIHRPVDCETVEKWNRKNVCESENMRWILDYKKDCETVEKRNRKNVCESENKRWILDYTKDCHRNTQWILDYTKDCPKCKRAIEKSRGCNHMTCGQPCRHQFCWLCLGDWRTHSANCNRYKEGPTTVDADAVMRERAKNRLGRYMHYYERWASNHKSREKARSDLVKMQRGLLKVIGEKYSKDEGQLSFIIEAWQQIIECRRVLKWTYAYGYYFPEGEHTKKKFFEYLQGEAEASLERLHRCAENELEDYYRDGRWPSIDFPQFRSNLLGLTKVTATYFENLVTALENGLEDVDSHVAPETHQASQSIKRHKNFFIELIWRQRAS